ncbi:MAG: cytochrome c family protein [Desulfobacterales bacterium]|nr:cytochrome c family protein [Desulfobacterales bacterium]
MMTLLLAMVMSLAVVSLLWAGTKVEDEFVMQTKEYKKHTYNLVHFTHKKHAEEYKISCGECHHDDQGKALDLKMGDNVQRCIECHTKPGKAPKGKGKKKLKGAEKRAYHAEALHQNCIKCHKAFNKSYKKEHKVKKGPAPTSCKKCHPGGKMK